MDEQVVNNEAESRYELRKGDDVAVADYVRRGNEIVFTHTFVPKHLEGRGIASEVAKFALDDVRKKGLQVEPRCPFIADYIRKNPAYQDLLVNEASTLPSR